MSDRCKPTADQWKVSRRTGCTSLRVFLTRCPLLATEDGLDQKNSREIVARAGASLSSMPQHSGKPAHSMSIPFVRPLEAKTASFWTSGRRVWIQEQGYPLFSGSMADTCWPWMATIRGTVPTRSSWRTRMLCSLVLITDWDPLAS